MLESTNQKITSAIEYKKQFGPKYEDIVLPSGAIFKIRKLQVADFLITVMMPLGWITEEDLKTWEDKTDKQRTDILMKNKEKDPESDLNFAKTVLEAGVVEPKLKRFNANEKKNELNIDDIDPIDIALLSQRIAKLSGFDQEFRDRVRPFREK